MRGTVFQCLPAADDDAVRLGDHHIHRHVVGIGLDPLLDELKVIAYADACGRGAGEQTVVVAFATADAVALTVVGHSRHHDQFDLIDVGSVIAGGLLDVERPQCEAAFVVGEYLEVQTVDARQVEMLACAPAVYERMGRKLVGQ